MLGRYLCCKERARLYFIEGWGELEAFSHRMEYGNLWHCAEEALAAGRPWDTAILAYAKELVAKHGAEASAEINKWYQVCKAQFPAYVHFWKKHADVKNRKPVYQEQVFKVPYRLPSGRTIYLRGKFDSVDQIGKGLYLQENKAKGDIYPERMLAELPTDLQTMAYTTALTEWESKSVIPRMVLGCRYNVIRRPLSSGKFCISQKKGLGKEKKGAETEEMFYARLADVIMTEAKDAMKENRDCWFFYRWKVEITPNDLKHYQRVTLNPILENILDDYEWWEACYREPEVSVYDYAMRARTFPHHISRHFVYPTGVWNPTLEGRESVYDEFLRTGSTRGLVKVDSLFRELE